MLAELSFEEILTARAIFTKHAANSARTVNQLRSICSDLGQYPSEAEVELVMEVFDHKVSFEDLTRYLTFLKRNFMKPEPKDADTVRAYVALGGHRDRGGNIDANTMRAMCRHFNLTIDLDAMLREVDEDDSGLIDYNEFKILLEGRTRMGNSDHHQSDDGTTRKDDAVSFAVEEEAQSDLEHLENLRQFLAAKTEEVNRVVRSQSIARKQSTRGNMEMSRKGTMKVPPLSMPSLPSPTKSQKQDQDEAAATEQAVEVPRAVERQNGLLNDPVYRMYMMTDPVVVGQRKGGAVTPRGKNGPLPPISPRSARSPRNTTRKSPTRTITTPRRK